MPNFNPGRARFGCGEDSFGQDQAVQLGSVSVERTVSLLLGFWVWWRDAFTESLILAQDERWRRA